jgi:glyoxylase-like metal-dependent hydrolase (beta-lactamase superfamily II)
MGRLASECIHPEIILTVQSEATPKLQIRKIHVGDRGVNSYIIACAATRECVVIDPGANPEKILANLEGASVRAILITHAHPGHVGAKDAIRAATGAPVAMHLDDAKLHLKSADRYLLDHDQVPFGRFTMEVLATPGHSPGGLCFKVGNHLFTGDTLMPGAVGRTDIPHAAPQQLLLSLHGRLLTLPDNTVVYPGHGANTTVGTERVSNPYLQLR